MPGERRVRLFLDVSGEQAELEPEREIFEALGRARVGLPLRVGDAEKAQRALAGCLQPVLGAGEETVVDYVKGTRSWSWKVGDGGRVVLGTRELDLTPAEKAAADQPAPWVSKFAAIVSAVDRCRL